MAALSCASRKIVQPHLALSNCDLANEVYAKVLYFSYCLFHTRMQAFGYGGVHFTSHSTFLPPGKASHEALQLRVVFPLRARGVFGVTGSAGPG